MIFPIIFQFTDNNDEIFLPILDYMVPNIKNGYYISNYGRIWSNKTNRILNPTIAKNGYYINTVITKSGKGVTVYPHRLMMLAFRYIENYKEMSVDHYDCNKLHNNLSNLEWVSLVENTRRAYENNLFRTGEDASWTKVSDKKAHEICRKYINREPLSKIANDLNCGLDSVFRIVHGIGRRNISSQYNIEQLYHGYFTDDEINKICKVFQDNKGYDFNHCINIIRNNIIDRYITRYMDSIIRNLYRHDPYCYYYISSKYDY